jgi:hypothetical protein
LEHTTQLSFVRSCRHVSQTVRAGYSSSWAAVHETVLLGARFDEPIVAMARLDEGVDAPTVTATVMAEFIMRGAPPLSSLSPRRSETADAHNRMPRLPLSDVTYAARDLRTHHQVIDRTVTERTGRWVRLSDRHSLLSFAGVVWPRSPPRDLLCRDAVGDRGPGAGELLRLLDYMVAQRYARRNDAATSIARKWKRVSNDPDHPVGRRVVEARYWALRR